MKKGLKRSILLTLVMTMLLSVMPVQAAAAKATKAKALKAYAAFLTKKSITMKSGESTNKVELADAKFALAYIDNNHVPELIIWAPAKSDEPPYLPIMSATQIYTYKKGKIVRKVGAQNQVETKSIKKYYKKKNLTIVNHWSGGDEYLTLSEKRKLWKTVGGRYMDGNANPLTKEQWNTRLKKLVGSTKATTIKYYKNTKANRNKYLK